jgi:hypothetical protein
MGTPERRSDLERRRRIDELLAVVTAAREEIVEAGLDAVHDGDDAEAAPRRRFDRTPASGDRAASGPSRFGRSDP